MAIGLAVMIVTVSVVLGFKHTIRNKVIGFGGHIQISNFLTMQNSAPYPICINDSMMNVLKSIEGIKHAERYALTQGILKTDSDFLGIGFKGIAQEYDTLFLHENLVEGSIPSFSDKKSRYKLLISKMTADKLKLNCGDKVFAYFISNNDVRARKFTVVSIYQTNMTQFDQNLCFTDLVSVRKINGWLEGQCSGAELAVGNFDNINGISQNVINKINRTSDKYGDTFTSQTIYETYPQIFSWLELLDINVWIIIALMICVAGFTMVSGLLIIILERTRMIGVLKALGATNADVRKVFLWFSVFIIGRGMVFGNIVGLGIVILQAKFGLITLDPLTYYVSTAPMEINIPLILLLNIATLAISVFVLIAPSYLVSHIQPAKSMRYE